MNTSAATTARTMWALFEPIHAVAYFAPEAEAAYEDAGLRGFWRGYFAGPRAAGLTGPAARPRLTKSGGRSGRPRKYAGQKRTGNGWPAPCAAAAGVRKSSRRPPVR